MVELQAIQIDHSSHTSSHHQSSLVLPCVVAIIVTAVDLSCSSLQLTLKCHCNDFSVGCLCSISPQQRLGIAGEPPSSPQTGPTMGSCSSARRTPTTARRTPTTVAHDAPQLSAPVSDRAPQVQWLLLAIAPNHALREGRRALRQEEVRSRRRAERGMAGGPSAESAARWTQVAAQLLAHRRAAFWSFLRSTAELPERRAVRRSGQRTLRAGISNAETGA